MRRSRVSYYSCTTVACRTGVSDITNPPFLRIRRRIPLIKVDKSQGEIDLISRVWAESGDAASREDRDSAARVHHVQLEQGYPRRSLGRPFHHPSVFDASAGESRSATIPLSYPAPMRPSRQAPRALSRRCARRRMPLAGFVISAMPCGGWCLIF